MSNAPREKEVDAIEKKEKTKEEERENWMRGRYVKNMLKQISGTRNKRGRDRSSDEEEQKPEEKRTLKKTVPERERKRDWEREKGDKTTRK